MEKLPEKIFVIAGTMDQYIRFRRHFADVLTHDMGFDLCHTDLVYVSDADMLRGQYKPWGYLIGTWADRPDLLELSIQLQLSRSSIEDFIEVAI